MADNDLSIANKSEAAKPRKELLEHVKKVFQKRLDEGRKVLDRKKEEYDRYRDLWLAKQRPRQHDWESSLVIPKAHYIIETLHPQILSTIFGQQQWVTFAHPRMDTSDMEEWFVWFCDRYVQMYIAFAELVKSAPIYGTAFLKFTMRDSVPVAEYEDPWNVVWDPTWRRPADIDGMPWVIHMFNRPFEDLEKATITRVRFEDVSQPVTDPQTGQQAIDPATGQPVVRTETIPIPYQEPLYFNLREVWDKQMQTAQAEVPRDDTTVTLDIPRLKVAEMWGVIETSLGTHDVDRQVYKPGKYEEYIVTAVLDSQGRNVETVIRCEPSTFKYYDVVKDKEVHMKPLVAAIYSLRPGSFDGVSALAPVESMIREQEAFQNMILDNLKRSVMTILKIRERSGLTAADLELSPYNHWYLRNMDDVEIVDFPGIDIGSFSTLHSLLNQEIDRTSNITMTLQGIPTSKRMTAREFHGSVMEAARRFSTYIQSLDRLSLRPAAFKVLLLASQMPYIIQERAFVLPDKEVIMTPEILLAQHEMHFAATGVESEFSKYLKQERLPRLMQSVSSLLATTQGQWQFDFPAMMKELQSVYDWANATEVVKPNPGVVPLDLIQQAVGQYPPDQQEQVGMLIQDVVQRAMQLAQASLQQRGKR